MILCPMIALMDDDEDNEFKITLADRAYHRVACLLQDSWDFAAGNNRLYARGLEPHMPDESLAYSGIAVALVVFFSRDLNTAISAGAFIMIGDLLINGQMASRDKAHAYDEEQKRRFQPR